MNYIALTLVALGLSLMWTGTAVHEVENFILAGLVFAIVGLGKWR